MIYGYINAPKRGVINYNTQKHTLEREAERLGFNELQLFIDKTAAPLANRVELQKLVQGCKEYDKILVYSAAILTENSMKLQVFEYMLQMMKLQLLYSMPKDIESAAIFRQRSAINEALYEYDKMQYGYILKGRRATEKLAIKGAAPYGYRKGKDDKGELQLIKHPIEQANILIIHELRAAGLSLRDICKELSERGIKPRRSKTWTLPSLSRLLKANPARLGEKPEPPEAELAAKLAQSLYEVDQKST